MKIYSLKTNLKNLDSLCGGDKYSFDDLIRTEKLSSSPRIKVQYAIIGLCRKYVKLLTEDESKYEEIKEKYKTLKEFINFFGEITLVDISFEKFYNDNYFNTQAEKICKAYERCLAEEIKEYDDKVKSPFCFADKLDNL